MTIAALLIAVENPQGSVRGGVDADRQEWSITMQSHHGYIEGTMGADGDEKGNNGLIFSKKLGNIFNNFQ